MSTDDPYGWPRPRPAVPPPLPPAPRRPRKSLLVPALAAAALLSLAAVVVLTVLLVRNWPSSGDPTSRPVTPRGDLTDAEKTNIEIYNKAKRSVVQVTTLAVIHSRWSMNVQQVPEGTGSGVVWDDKGNVVTNYHVVKSAVQNQGAVKVTLDDHSTWTVDKIRYYPEKDLAVVHIGAPASKLVPIDVGSSSDLQVGQVVYAIGNPFGLQQSLSHGIVSALGREINSDVAGQPIKNVIQTDAAINPGNSGGPLLDSAGRLIGVNTAILSESGSSAGIGFAIPVDEVNRVVGGLTITDGKVAPASLGITPAPDPTARRLGLKGVLILNVDKGGAAEKAGLRPTRRNEEGDPVYGDVITAIDGKPDDHVMQSKDLNDLVAKHQPGDTVTVSILRDGRPQDVKVELGAGGQ
jgi:S1-C subfamily serine protease